MQDNRTEAMVLSELSKKVRDVKGHTGFYYKNLLTGTEGGYGSDEAYLAASVIKFPLFLHILRLASEGKAKAAAKETVRKTRSKKTEAAKPAGAARRGRKPKVQAKEDKKIVEAAAAASVVTETEKPQQ